MQGLRVFVWAVVCAAGVFAQSPTGPAGWIVFGAPDGSLVCVDAARGALGWTASVSNGTSFVLASPPLLAPDASAVYFVRTDGAVGAANASNGALLWVTANATAPPTPITTASSPVFYGGDVFVTVGPEFRAYRSRDGVLVRCHVRVAFRSGRRAALGPSFPPSRLVRRIISSSQGWTLSIGLAFTGSPLLLAEGTAVVLVADQGGVFVFALTDANSPTNAPAGMNATAPTLIASFTGTLALPTSPIASQDGRTLYFADKTGGVYALTLALGALPYSPQTVSLTRVFAPTVSSGLQVEATLALNEFVTFDAATGGNSSSRTLFMTAIPRGAGVRGLDGFTGAALFPPAFDAGVSLLKAAPVFVPTDVAGASPLPSPSPSPSPDASPSPSPTPSPSSVPSPSASPLPPADGTVLRGSREGVFVVGDAALQAFHVFNASSGVRVGAPVAVSGVPSLDMLVLPWNTTARSTQLVEWQIAERARRAAGRAVQYFGPVAPEPWVSSMARDAVGYLVVATTGAGASLRCFHVTNQGMNFTLLWSLGLEASSFNTMKTAALSFGVAPGAIAPSNPVDPATEAKASAAEAFADSMRLNGAAGGVVTALTFGFVWVLALVRAEAVLRTTFRAALHVPCVCKHAAEGTGGAAAAESHAARARVMTWLLTVLCLFVLAYEWWWALIGFALMTVGTYGLVAREARTSAWMVAAMVYWVAAAIGMLVTTAQRIGECNDFGDFCGRACSWCAFSKAMVFIALVIGGVAVLGVLAAVPAWRTLPPDDADTSFTGLPRRLLAFLRTPHGAGASAGAGASLPPKGASHDVERGDKGEGPRARPGAAHTTFNPVASVLENPPSAAVPAVVSAPAPSAPAPVPPAASKGVWKTALDADGATYYWNTVTKETRWDPPT